MHMSCFRPVSNFTIQSYPTSILYPPVWNLENILAEDSDRYNGHRFEKPDEK